MAAPFHDKFTSISLGNGKKLVMESMTLRPLIVLIEPEPNDSGIEDSSSRKELEASN